MNIEYRQATSDDAFGVEYVAAHSWKETYEGILSKGYLDRRVKRIDNRDPQRIEKARKFLESTTDYYVAVYGGNVIGILKIGDGEGLYECYGHIGALYLLKNYQGLGIGRELFKLALEKLIDKGYDKIQLECMKGIDTINFYKKYGGYIVDTIDYPIKDEVVKADIVIFDDIKSIYDKLNNQI